MIDINKYIGIPFKNKGYDFDGADCYGLVHLFYKRELNITMPMFEEYSIDEDPIEVAKQMNLHIPLLIGEPTDSPEFGDICLFKFRGVPSHVGIYVGDNRVLHVLRKTFSTCEPLNSTRLKGKLEGFYGLRKRD